jgi:hypothetical protein
MKLSKTHRFQHLNSIPDVRESNNCRQREENCCNNRNRQSMFPVPNHFRERAARPLAKILLPGAPPFSRRQEGNFILDGASIDTIEEG